MSSGAQAPQYARPQDDERTVRPYLQPEETPRTAARRVIAHHRAVRRNIGAELQRERRTSIAVHKPECREGLLHARDAGVCGVRLLPERFHGRRERLRLLAGGTALLACGIKLGLDLNDPRLQTIHSLLRLELRDAILQRGHRGFQHGRRFRGGGCASLEAV